MKSLAVLSKIDINDCARQVIDTANLLTRLMRREMRRQRPAEVSLPQFRALRILRRHAGLSLSHLAARLDLTPASASKMIDVLAKHNLVERHPSALDRRKLELYLTARGHESLDRAEAATQHVLVEMLQSLPEERRAMVLETMRALQEVLTERDANVESE